MKKILFIVIVTIASLNAKPCMTDIYFGNGVWNTRTQGNEGQRALRNFMLRAYNARLDRQKEGITYDFYHAYNPSHGTLLDLMETFWQLKESGQITEQGFHSYYAGLLSSRDGQHYHERLQEIIANYNVDINTMFTQYKNTSFNKKHNVLLVAHSQGNLFGNKIYTMLTDAQKKKFSMVSVATPANSVAEGGPYVTADLDYVIAGIPNHLTANVDGIGHTFVGTYLGSSFEARTKIALYVKSAYDNLLQFSTCVEYKFVKVLMPNFAQIIFTARVTGTYGDEIIGSASLPIRNASWDNIQERWECGELQTRYTTGNGGGDNWAAGQIPGEPYSFKRMEWLPGRIHNKNELDSRKSVRENIIMGTNCITLSLGEFDELYDLISSAVSE